jgi:hypothetical protein
MLISLRGDLKLPESRSSCWDTISEIIISRPTLSTQNRPKMHLGACMGFGGGGGGGVRGAMQVIIFPFR